MMQANYCAVCGNPCHPSAELCKRCKKLRDRGSGRRQANKPARVRALKKAWDGSGFQCYYTGVRLDENDPRKPLYLTFDHRTPRQEQDVVVAAACVNDMKSDLNETEFKKLVLELAGRFKGGSFDDRVFELEHCKR